MRNDGQTSGRFTGLLACTMFIGLLIAGCGQPAAPAASPSGLSPSGGSDSPAEKSPGEIEAAAEKSPSAEKTSAEKTATPAAKKKKPERKPVDPAKMTLKDITFDDVKFGIEKGGTFDRGMLTPKIEQLNGQLIRIRGIRGPRRQITPVGITRPGKAPT